MYYLYIIKDYSTRYKGRVDVFLIQFLNRDAMNDFETQQKTNILLFVFYQCIMSTDLSLVPQN